MCLMLWRTEQIQENQKMLLSEITQLDTNLYVNTNNKAYYNPLLSLSFFSDLFEGEKNRPNTECIICLINVTSFSQHLLTYWSSYESGRQYKTTGILLNLLIIKLYLVDTGLKF